MTSCKANCMRSFNLPNFIKLSRFPVFFLVFALVAKKKRISYGQGSKEGIFNEASPNICR